MTPRERLAEQITAACPVVTVRVTAESAAGVEVVYDPAATPGQRAAADAVVAGFDWSAPAHRQWEEDRHPERKAVRQAAAQALADNTAYLALATPTAAQVRQQTDALTRQMSAVIRRLVQID